MTESDTNVTILSMTVGRSPLKEPKAVKGAAHNLIYDTSIIVTPNT